MHGQKNIKLFVHTSQIRLKSRTLSAFQHPKEVYVTLLTSKLSRLIGKKNTGQKQVWEDTVGFGETSHKER